ncbi:MAG: methylenetetrahydrofolate reductase [Candidatus Limnocylindrales bacterium]
MALRRSRVLAEPARAALASLVSAPRFELIPLKTVDAQSQFLPAGATVTVTASPAKGIEATVELSARLAERGFRVIPHLAARMVRDRAHLQTLLADIDAAGIRSVFVVGGDADEPGDFPDGLSLLRAMAEIGHRLTDIGIPAYPQGHATIPDDRLLAALADKQPFATSMTTQLCFDPGAIRTWLAARRAAGIILPVYFGIPGVAELHKLIEISARIGVRDSRRFLAKNTALVGRILRPGGYRPDGLLADLAPLVLDPVADVRGLHLYTFNQVETTEEWRQAYLAGLIALGPARVGA